MTETLATAEPPPASLGALLEGWAEAPPPSLSAALAGQRVSVESLEDCIAVDIFSPVREDWVRGEDSYLRG